MAIGGRQEDAVGAGAGHDLAAMGLFLDQGSGDEGSGGGGRGLSHRGQGGQDEEKAHT